MTTAREIMTPTAAWCDERATAAEAAQRIGMLSQADIARALPDARVGDLVGVISAAPPNS